MRSGTVGLTVFLVLAATFFPGRARACSIALRSEHTIDPAQVGVDQTPPQLAQPTVAELHNNESVGGGCQPKCGSDHSARLTNLATDDLTPVDRIGYRVTLVAGDAPDLHTGRTRAVLARPRRQPRGVLGRRRRLRLHRSSDRHRRGRQLERTRTVQITSGGGGCSVGHRRASDAFALAVLALALASARARPLRRR